MALIKADGTKMYVGAVLETRDHYWLDGMISEYAKVWDIETHQFETVEIGYCGSDGYNFIGTEAEIEVSTEIARDIIRTLKQWAYNDFCKSVIATKRRIEAGITAKVIRGRKIPKGTFLMYFGLVSVQRIQDMETELIAGCKDENGDKVWIKAEYLKNITPLKSPIASERKKYIKHYIKINAGNMVMRQAIGESIAEMKEVA